MDFCAQESVMRLSKTGPDLDDILLKKAFVGVTSAKDFEPWTLAGHYIKTFDPICQDWILNHHQTRQLTTLM